MTVSSDVLGDQLERHRAELIVHCYRMTGGYGEAEDLVQETFARALRAGGDFAGRASVRTWLYRIATNICLDVRRTRSRRRTLPFSAMDPAGDGGLPDAPGGVWVEPIPDRVLDAVPEDAAVVRETIELAFVVAIQQLPTRQRAVFIIRDVLGWSTSDAAIVCDIDQGAVKSALQRARRNLRGALPAEREHWTTASVTREEEQILERYLEAHASGTVDDLARVLREDLRVAYPQIPMWIDGRDAFIVGTREHAPAGEYRFAPFAANRQPALAIYHRAPDASVFTLVAMELLTVVDGRVAEVVDFGLPLLAAAFGLDQTVSV